VRLVQRRLHRPSNLTLQPSARLSAFFTDDEIDERIALLKGEVERLEAMKASKGSHRSVADALFKR
jgi:uncharacterized small protein (DUF1192 family)